MRYVINTLLLVWCLLGTSLPVSADMVGYWQNQAGQIVEVKSDGQVCQVTENGAVNLLQKVTSFLSNGHQPSAHWEYARAGQEFLSLRQSGKVDQSDRSRERILNQEIPMAEIESAVYYRVKIKAEPVDSQEKSRIQQEEEVQKLQEQTILVLEETTSINEETENDSEGAVLNQEEKEIRKEAVNQGAEKNDSDLDEEVASIQKTSVGQRYRKSSRKKSKSSHSSQINDESKSSSEELPKTAAEDNGRLLSCGWGVLIISALRLVTCYKKLDSKTNYLIF